MNLGYTEEQVAIADTVRRLCEDHCSCDIVRMAEHSGFEAARSLWDLMREAGLLGLLIEAEHGGAGLSLQEAVAVYEVLGRHLAPTPHFASSVVSALTLQRVASTPIKEKWLRRIADGSAVVVPAWLEPESGFGEDGIALEAEAVAAGYRLSGRKQHVPFAKIADALLVLARVVGPHNGDELELFLVDPKQPGLHIQASTSLAADDQSIVEFRSVEVSGEDRLTDSGCGWATWSEVVNEAIIADAAYAVGLAERALEMTVDYARERKQFGQPIGAFQAISHALVDCAIAVDGARALVQEAAWAHAHGYSWRALGAMAARFARSAARDVTAKAEQVHGGIGFTLDYDIQLYYRRAKQLQVNWWDKHFLGRRIAELVFEGGEALSGPDPFAPSAEEIAALNRAV